MKQKKALLQYSTQEFVEYLKSNKIRKFYFVYDRKNKKVVSSHKILNPIAEFINSDKRDFSLHEGLFFQVTKAYDTLQGAFVHRTNRGQAAGGIRYWSYLNMEEYLRDGLRLAKGMTHKNALAGLWWGGGKAVMAHNPAFNKNDPAIRESIYKEFGELITSLNGCYVTAEDVGTNVNDMANVYSKTRFTTCIPFELGGSGNPSIPTAKGVVAGMKAAVKFLSGDTLKGKTVALQGTGNVGIPLIKYLFEEKVKKIIAVDISTDNVERAKKEFPRKKLIISVVEINDLSIFSSECDILATCATGAVLNPVTIPLIKAKIICGAANNQLEDPVKDGKELYKRGIVYIPDFLTNRMGIVNCSNEQYGYVNDDPFIERHFSMDWKHSIYKTALMVLKKSKKKGQQTGKVAVKIADKLSKENHPVFGHRGQQIIDSLLENKWHENDDFKPA
jgi:glutamate dehydrogenase/leucine dehydrogenase